jgi:ABC-type iron transport system FetAB ATPase subunit
MGKGAQLMSATYRSFFGMTKEAFDPDLSLKDILETQDIASIRQRFDYTLRLGAIGLITGEVGSGKSTVPDVNYICALATITLVHVDN